MSNKVEEKLAKIASVLQETSHTFPEFGMTVQELEEATGIARTTIYRIIETQIARRWGIFQSNKKRQPYTYYVDNQTLIAYQIYYRDQQNMMEPPKAFPDDAERSAVYGMLNGFLMQAVGQFRKPREIHEQFVLNMTKEEEELLRLYHQAKTKSGKVVFALMLAFSNLED